MKGLGGKGDKIRDREREEREETDEQWTDVKQMIKADHKLLAKFYSHITPALISHSNNFLPVFISLKSS